MDQKDYQKEYYIKNKLKLQEKRKLYYYNNKKKIIEKQKERLNKNKKFNDQNNNYEIIIKNNTLEF